MKLQVEWHDGGCWRQSNVQASHTRNGNVMFRHDGKIYVVKDLREKEEVVVKTDGGWMKAGRVARGCVFLGEGESYSEYNERIYRENPEEAERKLRESIARGHW